jgi:hypothetical protein
VGKHPPCASYDLVVTQPWPFPDCSGAIRE